MEPLGSVSCSQEPATDLLVTIQKPFLTRLLSKMLDIKE